MTWNVVLSNRAERALGRVPARDRQRITQALLSMEQEPLSGDVVPLKGRTRDRFAAALDRGGSFSL
jgi:hypothetical protein